MSEGPSQDTQPQPAPPADEVAVIIPYFQRESGILERSLRSALRQSGAPQVRIIVVDDESPASVERELADLDPTSRKHVTVMKQKNQGPGPARNTALDAVPDTARYIAFLDSDDAWHEHHLSRAITMMEKGFDFYFADGDMEGVKSSLFETVKFANSDLPSVTAHKDLFEFSGNFLSLLLESSPIVTSTVVIRKEKLGAIRFPSSRGACEDLLYWLDIAQKDPRVGFSRVIEATGGAPGLHMSHRGDWKSNKSLRIMYDFDQYYRHVLDHVRLSPEQRDRFVAKSSSNRVDFLMTAAAMLKAGGIPNVRIVRDFLVANPGVIRDVVARFRPMSKRSSRS